MRQNAPRLIDPKNALQAVKERSFGIPDANDLLARIAGLDRLIGDQNRELQQLRSLLSIGQALSYASPAVLFTPNVKGSVTPTNVTSTSGTTITNGNITPAIGVRYLIVAFAGMAINAPAGQSIIVCTRIGASGSTIDGTRTTTVGGERWGISISFLEIIGDGSSVNVAGRARVTGGTGTVNDAISAGIGIPIGMVEM